MTFDNDPKRLAFEQLATSIRAVPRDEIRHVNLDISSTVSTVYAVLPRIAGFESQIAALPNTDHAAIANLPKLVAAVLHLQNELNSTTREASELGPKVEEGAALLAVITTDLKSLVLRKLLPADALADIDATNGFRTLAMNLGLVSNLAQRNWAAIVGRSGLTEADVSRASELNTEILRFLGERENDGSDAPQLATLRAQAFTLLVRAYEEVRRAMAYLRFHDGDVDDLVPSLYAGRGGRPRKDEKPAPTGATPQAASNDGPVAPAAAPGTEEDGPFR